MASTFNGATDNVSDKDTLSAGKPISIQDEIFQEIAQPGKAESISNRHGIAITLDQLLSGEETAMEWLVKGIIQRVGQGVIAGSSDLGKSTVSRQLAINTVFESKEFLGLALTPVHHKAIIVCTEDLQQAVASSIRKQIVSKPTSSFKNLRFIFDYEDLVDKLHDELHREAADLVVIDCFADVFGEELKDTHKIRLFLSKTQKLAQVHRCFFLFIHHTGKRTEDQEPSKNNLLSGQGFEAKMRLVLELKADKSNPSYRHLCIVKGNYLSENMKRESMVLEFHEDSLSFTNTGETVPFEFLVKSSEDPSKEKFLKALSLQELGHGQEKIAQLIGYKSKGAVSKLLKKGRENGWESISNTGNLQNAV